MIVGTHGPHGTGFLGIFPEAAQWHDLSLTRSSSLPQFAKLTFTLVRACFALKQASACLLLVVTSSPVAAQMRSSVYKLASTTVAAVTVFCALQGKLQADSGHFHAHLTALLAMSAFALLFCFPAARSWL